MTRTKITRREVDVIRKKFIEEIINELKMNGNEAKKAKIIKEEKSFWLKNCDLIINYDGKEIKGWIVFVAWNCLLRK